MACGMGPQQETDREMVPFASVNFPAESTVSAWVLGLLHPPQDKVLGRSRIPLASVPSTPPTPVVIGDRTGRTHAVPDNPLGTFTVRITSTLLHIRVSDPNWVLP